MSMMNWPDRASARSCASSGVRASASEATKRGPKAPFSAANPAAMPADVWKNRRRLSPSFGAISSAIA